MLGCIPVKLQLMKNLDRKSRELIVQQKLNLDWIYILRFSSLLARQFEKATPGIKLALTSSTMMYGAALSLNQFSGTKMRTAIAILFFVELLVVLPLQISHTLFVHGIST